MSEEIIPLTMPQTHQKFFSFFEKESISKDKKILDIGAGQGAFSKRLYEKGHEVSSCDLFPENFKFKPVDFKKSDVTQQLPYDDQSFDIAIAIEVSEHINDHEVFFKEVNRILKPGGILYITTPNILSLKSRVKFLFRGFFHSFAPLELKNYDGMQHISSLTIDQYNYIAVKNGFNIATINIDKKQKTSRFLFYLLNPFIWIFKQRHPKIKIHNTKQLLLGRLIFLKFEKVIKN